jgi:hypothetical protein
MYVGNVIDGRPENLADIHRETARLVAYRQHSGCRDHEPIAGKRGLVGHSHNPCDHDHCPNRPR